MFCACTLKESETALCTLEMLINLSLKGSKHHIHGILHADKSNFLNT